MHFWQGTFMTPCEDSQAKDTFLQLPNWRKGLAFIQDQGQSSFEKKRKFHLT